MGFRIEDGRGRGRFAAVNPNFHLEVAAVSTPIIANRASVGDSYSMLGRHTIQSTSATEWIAHVTNGNPDRLVYIQTITYTVNTTTGVLMTLAFGTTRTSGGTLKVPVQLNRSKANESGVVTYDNSSNDLVVGTTSIEEFSEVQFSMPSSAYFNSESAVILGPDDTVAVKAVGTAGDIITVSSFMFEALIEDN